MLDEDSDEEGEEGEDSDEEEESDEEGGGGIAPGAGFGGASGIKDMTDTDLINLRWVLRAAGPACCAAPAEADQHRHSGYGHDVLRCLAALVEAAVPTCRHVVFCTLTSSAEHHA